MKNRIEMILRKSAGALLVLLALLVGCQRSDDAASSHDYAEKEIETIEHLSHSRVVVGTGSVYEHRLEKDFPQMTIMRMETETDMLQSLVTRKCDALIMDGPSMMYHANSIKGIRVLEKPYMTAEVGAIFNKNNAQLRSSFNEFLSEIRSNGIYDQIYDRWLVNGHTSQIPEIVLPAEGEPLKVSLSSSLPPMVFIKNGSVVGMDVELAMRFAQYINRPIEFYDMNFSGIVPSIVGGSCDMAISCIYKSEERTKVIDFSDTYFVCDGLVVVYDAEQAMAASDTRFIESLKTSFRRNIIDEDRYMLILDGLKTTAWISLFAALLGTLLGGAICWMKMCRIKFLEAFASIYISIVRGTPVLVLLMIMFYVIFAGSGVSAVVISIITFAINFSAYVSEMFRSSIESIDRGQTEAGVSLGFTQVQTFVYIVMPQAFKQVLPVYKGEMISLVKMTSIVGYIAVQDVTKMGDIIRSRTFDAFFPLIVVAVLYFILAWVFSLVLDVIGKKMIKG